MITLFRSKFKIRILYKSGNSAEFWATAFCINKGVYTWSSLGNDGPLLIGSTEAEAVYQLDTHINWLRYLRDIIVGLKVAILGD